MRRLFNWPLFRPLLRMPTRPSRAISRPSSSKAAAVTRAKLVRLAPVALVEQELRAPQAPLQREPSFRR